MKLKHTMAMLAALGLLASSPLYAQDEDTMDVVDEETTAEETMNRLELPEDASETAVERSEYGLDTANQAREGGREFGQERAEEARERGREARESAGESARDDARERGGRPDGAGPPASQ